MEIKSQNVLNPNQAYCVGCDKSVSKSFCRTGSVLVGKGGYVKEVEEVTFNPLTGTFQTELVEKRIPTKVRRKGLICSECVSDYRTVTYKHKDGSTSWEPVVKLDESATEKRTLNSGDYRERRDTSVVSEGQLEWNPWEGLKKSTAPEVDRKCYSKFGRGR